MIMIAKFLLQKKVKITKIVMKMIIMREVNKKKIKKLAKKK